MVRLSGLNRTHAPLHAGCPWPALVTTKWCIRFGFLCVGFFAKSRSDDLRRLAQLLSDLAASEDAIMSNINKDMNSTPSSRASSRPSRPSSPRPQLQATRAAPRRHVALMARGSTAGLAASPPEGIVRGLATKACPTLPSPPSPQSHKPPARTPSRGGAAHGRHARPSPLSRATIGRVPWQCGRRIHDHSCATDRRSTRWQRRERCRFILGCSCSRWRRWQQQPLAQRGALVIRSARRRCSGRGHRSFGAKRVVPATSGASVSTAEIGARCRGSASWTKG